ncbi:uroporphyrinogen-III synthase [Thalassolituus maritimus]|uniref:Uroporphyrinogen-III synthase n=1 Tax=Thalassolituus maritimus TaxID=484498 RepID=A0ABP9ZXQ4_9GAMM
MDTAVVITRPADQADELLSQVKDMGLDVRHHPLIDITRFEDDDSGPARSIRQAILNIDQYQAVIAISQNAAESGLSWLDDYWPQHPVGIRWYAVGPTTAESLRQAGLPVEMPVDQFDSEGVLALPSLQAVDDEKILIWRGVGGRETLANILRERGAQVDYAELYERRQIDWAAQDWERTLRSSPVLVLSSGQALAIAQQQVPDIATRVRAIIVPSERVATYAREQGCTDVVVAASARNEDTLHSLRAWFAANR